MLKIIEKAKCLPVTLKEARDQLSVDASNSSMDALINGLIVASSANAETMTGRVLVESKWQWNPEAIVEGISIPFPTAPVTGVEVYNLDETISVGGEYTDISGDVVTVNYPSLEPQGEPLKGSLLPLSGFPSNYKIVLTVGYPVTETTTKVTQTTAPTLVVASTKYTSTKMSLVLDRPVTGTATVSNFTVSQNDIEIVPTSLAYTDGRVDFTFDATTLVEGGTIKLSFIEGEIYDEFENFVEPISNITLPTVAFGTESDFVTPTPVPTQATYTGNTPEAIKTAILMRIGFLYTQRTGSALKTGQNINMNFSDDVVRMLLNPYRVEFA